MLNDPAKRNYLLSGNAKYDANTFIEILLALGRAREAIELASLADRAKEAERQKNEADIQLVGALEPLLEIRMELVFEALAKRGKAYCEWGGMEHAGPRIQDAREIKTYLAITSRNFVGTTLVGTTKQIARVCTSCRSNPAWENDAKENIEVFEGPDNSYLTGSGDVIHEPECVPFYFWFSEIIPFLRAA